MLIKKGKWNSAVPNQHPKHVFLTPLYVFYHSFILFGMTDGVKRGSKYRAGIWIVTLYHKYLGFGIKKTFGTLSLILKLKLKLRHQKLKLFIRLTEFSYLYTI